MRTTYQKFWAKRRMDAERARRGPDLAERLEVVGAAVGEYPAEWPEVAKLVKTLASWHCERCGHPNAPSPWVLTVHHLDGDKYNLNHWNLSALCQRCHLRVQARVNFRQDWLFDHSPWMARHVEDYNEWAAARALPLLSLTGVAERSYANEWPS